MIQKPEMMVPMYLCGNRKSQMNEEGKDYTGLLQVALVLGKLYPRFLVCAWYSSQKLNYYGAGISTPWGPKKVCSAPNIPH